MCIYIEREIRERGWATGTWEYQGLKDVHAPKVCQFNDPLNPEGPDFEARIVKTTPAPNSWARVVYTCREGRLAGVLWVQSSGL